MRSKLAKDLAYRARYRTDGLSVFHAKDGRKMWWCWMCDARTPKRVFHVDTIREVFDAWDWHKASSTHTTTRQTHDQVDEIARKIGDLSTPDAG